VSARSLLIEFEGPFTWPGTNLAPSIFTAEVGKESGLCLWTVRLDEGSLIYYVGETGRSFAQRMLEHYREHASGGYHLYEPREFSHGRKVALWHGLYGPDREESVIAFIRRFKELSPAIAELADLYQFYVAPLRCEKRLRERIEAALAGHLYEQPGIVGEFQDSGIRYHGRSADEDAVQAGIRCTTHLLGVPEFLWV